MESTYIEKNEESFVPLGIGIEQFEMEGIKPGKESHETVAAERKHDLRLLGVMLHEMAARRQKVKTGERRSLTFPW